MFTIVLPFSLNWGPGLEADRRRRQQAEMQAMQEQQMTLHAFMKETGASMVRVTPDGTMVPIYNATPPVPEAAPDTAPSLQDRQ